MEYVVFDKMFKDIPEEDLPDPGSYVVALSDTQKSWIVFAIEGDGSFSTVGSFAKQHEAVKYAKELCAPDMEMIVTNIRDTIGMIKAEIVGDCGVGHLTGLVESIESELDLIPVE